VTASASALPALSDSQRVKLKQLSVVSAAESSKVRCELRPEHAHAVQPAIYLRKLVSCCLLGESHQRVSAVFTSIFIRCAGVEQVIPYAELMAALDIANIRELEDLLITECFYSGLVTGKLDQARQCLRVADAASRDVRAADVAPVLDGLAAWCGCACTCMHFVHALLLLRPPLLSGAPPSQAPQRGLVPTACTCPLLALCQPSFAPPHLY